MCSVSQLTVKVQNYVERIGKMRLQQLKMSQTIQSLREKLDIYSSIVLAIASKDIARVRTIIATAIAQNRSGAYILEQVCLSKLQI